MEATPVTPSSPGSAGTNAKSGRVGNTYASEQPPVVGGQSTQAARTAKPDAQKDWLPPAAAADPAFWLKAADR